MVDFNEILVPVDGSEGSHRAARWGAQLAAAVELPLKLAYVVPMTPESVMATSRLSAAEVEELQRSRAREVLDKAKAALAEQTAGSEPGEVVLTGDAANEILHYMKQHPNTLVVMGRRGLSPIKTLMMGSVSEKVMRHAPGIVTLVN
jgi:nucleotide-binding universal stress UspA family protein